MLAGLGTSTWASARSLDGRAVHLVTRPGWEAIDEPATWPAEAQPRDLAQRLAAPPTTVSPWASEQVLEVQLPLWRGEGSP